MVSKVMISVDSSGKVGGVAWLLAVPVRGHMLVKPSWPRI